MRARVGWRSALCFPLARMRAKQANPSRPILSRFSDRCGGEGPSRHPHLIGFLRRMALVVVVVAVSEGYGYWRQSVGANVGRSETSQSGLLAGARAGDAPPFLMDHDSAQPSRSPAVADSTAGRAVWPTGWRRTAQGWQHVSNWQGDSSRPSELPTLIAVQQAREPAWVSAGMRWLRGLSPLVVVAGQALMVVGVFVGWQLSTRDQQPSADSV